MWIIFVANSLAAELSFTPDRPGVGDSTGVVGAGHLMVEGGVVVAPTTPSFGTSGLVGRIGFDEGGELRVRAPDVGWNDGVALGPVGLGAKLAGSAGNYFSASVVPEVLFDLQSASISGNIGVNAAFSYQRLGIWGHGSTSVGPGDIGLFMGGGASVSLAPAGLYANGGYVVGGGPMAGAGGWLGLSKAAQVDLGVDVYDLGGTNAPVINLGISLGV